MAGPVFEGYGLVILSVSSRDEAEAIMAAEPSVAQGVHRYQMSDMRVSLMAHTVPGFRYAEELTDRSIVKEATVSATIDQVWQAWTTTEGITSWLSDAARVELRIGGPFEIYFALDLPPGLRGSEDCKILSYLPHRMFSFEWNAPPTIPEIRKHRTFVVVEFEPQGENSVHVRLEQYGWGVGEHWDATYDYFNKAWAYVLTALEKHFNESDNK
jgi:uncharacterized protein YndB with AHSA1/START domain